MNRLVLTLAIVAVAVPWLGAHTPEQPAGWCGNAAAAYQSAAGKGDPDAMFCLGIKHLNGNGVARDSVQATRLFIKAADAGHAGAMYWTGIAFWSGRGVEQDMVEAYKWLELSSKFTPGKSPRARTSLEGLSRVLSADQIADAKKREVDWEADFQKRKKF